MLLLEAHLSGLYVAMQNGMQTSSKESASSESLEYFDEPTHSPE